MRITMRRTCHRAWVLAIFLGANAMSGPTQAETSHVQSLLDRHACTACHALEQRVVGPGFREVADRYAGKTDYLAKKIQTGGSGVWGSIPMPAQTAPESDIRIIAAWLANGMK